MKSLEYIAKLPTFAPVNAEIAQLVEHNLAKVRARAERDPVPCFRKDRTGSHEGQPHISSDRSRLDPDDRHVQRRSRDLPRDGKLQHRDEDFASHELYQRVRKRAPDLRISLRR